MSDSPSYLWILWFCSSTYCFSCTHKSRHILLHNPGFRTWPMVRKEIFEALRRHVEQSIGLALHLHTCIRACSPIYDTSFCCFSMSLLGTLAKYKVSITVRGLVCRNKMIITQPDVPDVQSITHCTSVLLLCCKCSCTICI